MALKILQNCVNCDMCLEECPNAAIHMGDSVYEIDPSLCTECVGYYDDPQCVNVCPVSRCIVADPAHVETRQQLEKKLAALLQVPF